MKISRNQIVVFSNKSLLLSLQFILFTLIYTITNWYAASQGVTESIISVFDLSLPFIEWMIIPYLSSAIYFVIAFFYVNDPLKYQQLNQHLIFATLIAGWIFYLFPLYFGQMNLVIHAPWKMGFDLVYLVDQPYNQVPSLHVVYGLLLWSSLWKRFSFFINGLISIGIVMMLLSTVFTYQHRIIDVITGFALSLSILLFTRRYLLSYISLCYLSLTSTCALLGFIFIKSHLFSALIMLYFAVGFAFVFSAYITNKPCFLGKKTNGTRHLFSSFLIFPYILIYWLLWILRSNVDRNPAVLILPWLYVGRRLSRHEEISNVTCFIDIGSELPATLPYYAQSNAEVNAYYYFPLLDLEPISLKDAVNFCERIQWIKYHHKEAVIYLQCTMGISRSYAMTACYLVWSGTLTPQEVKPYLFNINDHVILRDTYLKQDILEQLAERRTNAHNQV